MKNVLSRFSAVCVAMLFLVGVREELSAQPAPETPSARPASPEDLSQAELLKAYLQLREQLHATQLAIVSNRAEADATARAQAAALTEKMESIKSAMETERARQQTERDRQQAERERQQAEHERQQAETQRSTRTVLWVAAGFAGVGLLTMLLMPLLQVRAINRMAQLATQQPQFPAPSPQALLHADAAVPDQPVAASNQRLLSVIDRMERRIMELEHTAASPLPVPPARPSSAAPTPASLPVPNPVAVRLPTDVDPARRAVAANDQATWIAVLMNKARSLLSTNRVLDAVVCYDEILRLDRTHADALVKKGAALERLNRFEEAIECYERAIASDRRMTLAHLHKGAACHRVGRYEEAVECFEEALRVEEKEQRTPFAPEGAAIQGDVARDSQVEAAGTTAAKLSSAGAPRVHSVTTLH